MFVHILMFMVPMTFALNTNTYQFERNRTVYNKAKTLLQDPFASGSITDCSLFCAHTMECTTVEFDEKTMSCSMYTKETVLDTAEDGLVGLGRGQRRAYALKFDPTTMRSSLYMSKDQKVLSNTAHGDLTKWPEGNDTLTKYPGALLDSCFDPNMTVSLEFHYEYYTKIYIRGLMIEFGLVNRTDVDKTYFIGHSKYAWSFHWYQVGDPDYIKLLAFRKYSYKKEIVWDKNVAGTYRNGTLIAIINLKEYTFALYNETTDTLLYKYTDVVAPMDLCFVFGMFGYWALEASISLVNAFYFV